MIHTPRRSSLAATAALAFLTLGTVGRIDVAVAAALTVTSMASERATQAPLPNAEFFPPAGATPAAPFAGTLRISQALMQTSPALASPIVGGRDARLFPAVTLAFFAHDDVLVPIQRGEMVAETTTRAAGAVSYWRVIPQFGRVWKQPGDGEWSRAAFPLMLVNDTENHAHQGIATFLYRSGAVTRLRFQFVQQTAPYLVRPHFVGWGSAATELVDTGIANLDADRAAAAAELGARLPAKPWEELLRSAPARALDGFGGPLDPKWVVATALVRDGTLYYRAAATPYGPYPYPLEMRFGVRSIMKSVGAPLALLHLAQVYGPYVLTLRVGAYVKGLDPKYDRVRFIDAASMASGFGGMGTFRTNPNDVYDGYLDGDYDGWYTAPSNAEKIAHIVGHLHPYPWEPGTVMRYRDQDFYLLGAAINGFLKSVRGPSADVWQMLEAEVFAPIGILHAPAVRTREADGHLGQVWFNAGYYPTLDDLAKIALLYQHRGEHAGQQILNRELVGVLLAGRDALVVSGDRALGPQASPPGADTAEHYRLGVHYMPYRSARDNTKRFIPAMTGSGENEVILFPNGLISIRTAKAAALPDGTKVNSGAGPMTIEAVERLAPF